MTEKTDITTFDPNDLIDGVLPPVETAEATIAVRNDDALAATVGRAAAEAALIRSVMELRAAEAESNSSGDDAFIVQRLAARLNEDRSPSPRQRPMMQFRHMTALAIGILGLGVTGGVAGSSWMFEQNKQELQMAALEQRSLLQQTIQNALEAVPSGQTVVWRPTDKGSAEAKVTPIRTYKSASGRLSTAP